MPRSNFIEMITMPGEGRCRVCDYAYSINLPKEVKAHNEYHRRYLDACDGVGAPVNEAKRADMLEEGLRLQREGETLAERVKGAEMWLVSKYHEHLVGVLLQYVGRRLDLREFFTRMEDNGLKGRFDDDVAYEMRRRYSDHLM